MFGKKLDSINEILNVVGSARNGILEPRIVNVKENDRQRHVVFFILLIDCAIPLVPPRIQQQLLPLQLP